MLKTAILNYIHHHDNPTGFASILDSTDTRGLTDTLTTLLRSNDHEQIARTCLFIRDLILIAPNYDLGFSFRGAFHTSAIIPELERLLFSENYFIRQTAIYTLGKTCSTQSLPALHSAFPLYREDDPLTLPDLIFEIRWLEGAQSRQVCWTFIDTMIASISYATRWAVLSILESWQSEDEPQRFQHYLEKLRTDGHPFVRSEAEYAYQEFQFHLRLPGLTKSERKQQRKEIKRHEPPLRFSCVKLQFGNDMLTNALVSYSVEELDRFLATNKSKFIRGGKESTSNEETVQ